MVAEPSAHLIGVRAEGNGQVGSDAWSIPQVELERFVATRRQTRFRPGYDLTLRPPKSVSVLWALSDEPRRSAIRDAHAEAVDEVVRYYEDRAVFARAGKGDRRLLASDGIVAAAFDHRTSRAGDPLLHTHVVTAKPGVQWRAADPTGTYSPPSHPAEIRGATKSNVPLCAKTPTSQRRSGCPLRQHAENHRRLREFGRIECIPPQDLQSAERNRLGKLLRTPEEDVQLPRRPHRRSPQARSWLVRVQVEVGQLIEEGIEGAAHFDPGHLLAETVVGAEREAEVAVALTEDVESVRFAEDRRISVGGTEGDVEQRVCRNGHPVEDRVAGRRPRRHHDRSVPSESLLDRLWHQLAVLLHGVELIWVGQEAGQQHCRRAKRRFSCRAHELEEKGDRHILW